MTTPGHATVGQDGWLGLWNARDLGGTPAGDGQAVREGALVRSEAPVRLDELGWDQVVDHGVHTVIDLRTTQEAAEKPSTPDGVDADVVNVSLEEGLEDDEQFSSWSRSRLIGTPLYYEPFLQRWPERCAQALQAVAGGRRGGVLVHCAKGRDRTGLVVALVLLVCKVGVEEIVADYADSGRRLAGPVARAAGAPDESEETQRVLATQGFTEAAAAMRHFLLTADPLGRLRAAGLRPSDEAALRARMLGGSPGSPSM